MADGITGGKWPPAATGQGRRAIARFAIALGPKSVLKAETAPRAPLDVHSMT